MDLTLSYCKRCGFWGAKVSLTQDMLCPVCKSKMIDSEIDCITWGKMSDNEQENWLSNNIIHDDKTTQYIKQRVLYNQNGNTNQVAKPANIPHCPICGSADLKKLSTVGKAAKIGLFGIFGAGSLGKTYKCNNCGVKF